MPSKPTHRAARPSCTCIALSGIGLFAAALFLLAAPLACTAAQSEPPAASVAAQPGHEPTIAESPFANFVRLVRGHWRLTLQSGSVMDTSWQPGPGGHSLRGVTAGHGGGVGIGFSQHAGQVIVADGTDQAAARLERVLTNDPMMGVFRHADAGYDQAAECARDQSVPIPMPR